VPGSSISRGSTSGWRRLNGRVLHSGEVQSARRAATPRWIAKDERLQTLAGRAEGRECHVDVPPRTQSAVGSFSSAARQRFHIASSTTARLSRGGRMGTITHTTRLPEPAQEAFREWLRVRYTTVDGLNSGRRPIRGR
jgi:hypothetical protein